MYKNVIGLNKIIPKIKSSKASESISLNSANFNSNDTRSETNLVFDAELDQEYDDFGYPLSYNSINKPADDTTDSINEEQEDLYTDELADNQFILQNTSPLDNKTKQGIRLDLINEIKDEILDDQHTNVGIANLKSIDEDEEEVDLQEDNESMDVNLNNLRVCIDDIEELTDKSNKTCFVFVIQIWNLQPTLKNLEEGVSTNGFEDVPTWYVKRKYDEFYVLDTRLKEFHGYAINAEARSSQLNANLPAKQRTMFLQSNAKTLEYLNSIKLDFTKYLQCLITNPILSYSQLIRSFLDPNSIEFGSSIFNDISNLGKMVKGVPLKLRLERGQSLDSFLLTLLQSVKDPKPKNAKIEPITEDIVAETLNNKLFNNSGIFSTNKKLTKCMNNSSEVLTTPFESFLLLIKLIYKLPNTICLIIFSLRKFIQSSFDYLLYKLISKKVGELTTPESIQKYIRLFQELIFDDDADEEKIPDNKMYSDAFKTINQFIYEEIKLEKFAKIPKVSKKDVELSVEKGTRLWLESFQYPLLNKQLTYYLLDAILEELFPELISLKK